MIMVVMMVVSGLSTGKTVHWIWLGFVRLGGFSTWGTLKQNRPQMVTLSGTSYV